ncbi:MAG: DNA repair protein RecO [Oscillospiraceae bacterium]|nr:DNA repair protein RecO [Oscillospiraceae bacterium]
MYKTLRGLVLREVKYKESSKMLTVLTEEGKLSCEGRGAMRKGSKIAAAAQQLTLSELTLFENRGRYTLTEASVVEDFSALREDFADFSLGVYFAELLETVSDEEYPNPALLSLGLNGLFALSRRLYGAEHIKACFELRLCALAGFAPELTACAVCGEKNPERPRLNLRGGVLHCAECRTEGRSAELCPASLAAMRHVTHADAKKIYSFTLDAEAEKRFRYACEQFLLSQLDRGFGSLDYWRSISHH